MKPLIPILSALVMLSGNLSADPAHNSVHELINNLSSEIKAAKIGETTIENILEVELTNGDYLYVTKDAQYIFTGDLLHVTKRGIHNLTQSNLQEKRSKILKSTDLSNSITFESEGVEKAELIVFTDVSCGYCRKLHQHIDAINSAGITVHYLAYPRSGPSSETSALMNKVWCADDQRAALTEAKLGNDLTDLEANCESPVPDQYSLGKQLGIEGTPSIFNFDGRRLGGYITVDQLKAVLQI